MSSREKQLVYYLGREITGVPYARATVSASRCNHSTATVARAFRASSADIGRINRSTVSFDFCHRLSNILEVPQT